MEFIEVMRRNDTREMLAYMDKIYESRIGLPGWTNDESILPSKKDMVMAAHDMIRLALSISKPAKDLLKEIGELKKEIKELRSHKNSDIIDRCKNCGEVWERTSINGKPATVEWHHKDCGKSTQNPADIAGHNLMQEMHEQMLPKDLLTQNPDDAK